MWYRSRWLAMAFGLAAIVLVLWIALLLSLSLNVGLGYILRRYITRLFQYDDLYQILIDDVETNLRQFDRIRGSSLMSDDDQVRNAHRNMMTMAARMDEFATRMEEIEGKPLRKVTKPMQPINVTREAEKLDG